MIYDTAKLACFFSNENPKECIARRMRAASAGPAGAGGVPDINECETAAMDRTESGPCTKIIVSSGSSAHDKALAYAYRGVFMVTSGLSRDHQERAHSDATKAMHLDPKVGEAYFVLGFLASDLGPYWSPRAGILYLDRAIAVGLPPGLLGPAYMFRAIDHRVLGNATHDKSQYQLAIDDYGQQLQIDPNNADSYAARASIEQKLGQVAAAQSDLATSNRLKKTGNAQ